jgi:hypothetical protein
MPVNTNKKLPQAADLLEVSSLLCRREHQTQWLATHSRSHSPQSGRQVPAPAVNQTALLHTHVIPLSHRASCWLMMPKKEMRKWGSREVT